jgi:hypothetical protein
MEPNSAGLLSLACDLNMYPDRSSTLFQKSIGGTGFQPVPEKPGPAIPHLSTLPEELFGTVIRGPSAHPQIMKNLVGRASRPPL